MPAIDARPVGRTGGRAVEVAADVLARHLAAGGRRWLLDLRHDAGEPGRRAPTALAAALDRIGTTDVLVGPAGAATLRAEATPQDVLVLLAPTALAREACLRAEAWGVASVLLPTDDGDARGVADVVLGAAETDEQVLSALGDIGQRLADTGAVPGPRATGERGEVCITCADEATVCEVAEVLDPVQVRALTPDGLVDVDTTLVEPVAVHDLLLVHARTAIARLDPRTDTTSAHPETHERGPR